MKDTITGILCVWSILGAFVVCCFIKPENRKQALIQLIISGPMGWLIFLIISPRIIRGERLDGRK